MAGATETGPHIIIDPSAEANVARRIQLIDELVHEDPDAFTAAFAEVRDTATLNTVDYQDRDTNVVSLSREPHDLIVEFFRQRYDLEARFDTATEAAINTDKDHAKLLEKKRNIKPERIMTGVMHSMQRSNAEADPARDAVRLSSFGLYLGRVAAHAAKQAADTIPGIGNMSRAKRLARGAGGDNDQGAA